MERTCHYAKFHGIEASKVLRMKFPGRRSHKHYFPVTEKGRESLTQPLSRGESIYVVGLDQLLVDIEIDVSDEFLAQQGFVKGQSFIISDELADEIYWHFKEHRKINGEFPGGAIGNTLHNFCVLSDSHAVALGAIKNDIQVGDYAFKYLTKTHSLVDLSYLQSSTKPMGRALCFITPDSERTFAISKGCMNDLGPESISESVIQNSCCLLISAYSLRNLDEPIAHATIKACEYAKKHDVPVVMSLGTSSLVESMKDYLKEFISDYISVVAMNRQEAYALTSIADPLLACEAMLEITDLVLLTVGKKGLYVAGHVDAELKRETNELLHTKSIVEYNKYEYSRSMRRKDCQTPLKMYTHVNPFKGGPVIIKNTNGAGDAALAALLHDLSANKYHREVVKNSPKHDAKYLTYSSISQISKYANRVSYEVLLQSSPRLFKGLPEKDECLEEGHWRP